MGFRDLGWLAVGVYLGFVSGVEAEQIWTYGFKRVAWLSSIVVGDKLYLDGGEIANETYGYTMGSTLQIDLSKPWSNNNVVAKYANKPFRYPYSRAPAFWSDGSNLYSYAGVPYFFDGCIVLEACTQPVWHGDIDNGVHAVHPKHKLPSSWQLMKTSTIKELQNANTPMVYKISADGFVPRGKNPSKTPVWIKANNQPPKSITPMQAPSITQSGDMVYSLGGFAGLPYDNPNYNSLTAVTGMSSWNVDGSDWKNKSSHGFRPIGRNAYGQAVNLPFGPKGSIAYIGGYAPPQTKFGFASEEQAWTLQDMSTINIYDIASGEFYTQTASGAPPLHRFAFCAVSASEAGSNTAEIYIHGGFANTRNNEKYSHELANVWVLSIPSFVWRPLPHSLQQLMRAGVTCEVIGNRQMIVVGGYDPSDAQIGLTADPWANGILIWDMSEWKWTAHYNPNAAPYKRNPTLIAQTNHNLYPPRWNSSKVKKYFMKYAPQHVPPQSSGGSNIGAIAGGVVGGVVGLALIIGVFFFWRWKNHKSKLVFFAQSAEEGRAAEAPFQNEKPAPQELPVGKPPAELGPPALWELEQPHEVTMLPTETEKSEQNSGSSTSTSEDTKNDDELNRGPVNRFEMEG